MKKLRKWVFWMRRYDDTLRDLRAMTVQKDEARREAQYYRRLYHQATDVIRLQPHLLSFEPTVRIDYERGETIIRLHIRENGVQGSLPHYQTRKYGTRASSLAEALHVIEAAAWDRVQKTVRDDLRNAMAQIPRLIEGAR